MRAMTNQAFALASTNKDFVSETQVKTVFFAEQCGVLVPYVLDTNQNVILEKMFLLSQIRVRRQDELVTIRSIGHTYVPVNVSVSIQPTINVKELFLSNGLVLPIVDVDDSALFVYSLIEEKIVVKKFQDIDSTTDLIVVDASATFNSVSDDRHEKKSPCRKCFRTFVLFRSYLNEGLWPVFLKNNRVINDRTRYSVQRTKDGRQYVCVSIEDIFDKQYQNKLVVGISRKQAILLNGALIV